MDQNLWDALTDVDTSIDNLYCFRKVVELEEPDKEYFVNVLSKMNDDLTEKQDRVWKVIQSLYHTKTWVDIVCEQHED